MGFVDAQREERGEEPRANPNAVEAIPGGQPKQETDQAVTETETETETEQVPDDQAQAQPQP